MKLPYHLAQPPARALVKTGPEAAALVQTARRLAAKGRPLICRITAPVKGESFALYLHAATNRHTGETWTLATFASRTVAGRVRRVIIDPDGRNWTLLEDEDETRALTSHTETRAVCQADKYRAKLWQVLQDSRLQDSQKGN